VSTEQAFIQKIAQISVNTMTKSSKPVKAPHSITPKGWRLGVSSRMQASKHQERIRVAPIVAEIDHSFYSIFTSCSSIKR
jgi:hypothetical protein